VGGQKGFVLPRKSWYEILGDVSRRKPWSATLMYNDHFGLKESPFSIAPDPRYLYLGGAHREALAHLIYGVRGEGGFVLLTGEVGTGKTTICRCLLEQVPETVQVALVLNPSLNVPELLATVCDDLGVAYPHGNVSNKVFIDALNRFLLDSHARGLTTVLIVDEAQNLSAELLEQLRLLTNLETTSRKLLQIILIGQPELRELLTRTDLRQVAQRITARYHLGALDRADLSEYLRHRLAVGGVRRQLFAPRAVASLYRSSRGIPRLVNVLADRALLGAYAQGRTSVDAGTVKQAGREVLDPPQPSSGILRWALLGLLVVAAGLAAFGLSRLGEAPGSMVAAAGQAGNVAPPTFTDDLRSVFPARGSDDRRPAEGDLLRLWGLEPAGPEALCGVAQSAGLACLQSVGTLPLLRLLDRPAVLTLRTGGGETSYVTLVGFRDDKVALLSGGEVLELPPSELARYWLGEYTLLWRPPLPAGREIRRGDRGGAVAWLARSLPDSAESAGAGEGGGLFDEGLEIRVKQFQLRHGLLPDGIAGAKTLILLNQRLGTPGPRLAHGTMES
jgi:general secretion pathway protein A